MSEFYVPIEKRVFARTRYFIPVPATKPDKHRFDESQPWIIPLKEPGTWHSRLKEGPAYVYTYPGTLNQLMPLLDRAKVDFSKFTLQPMSVVLRMLHVT